MAGNGEDRGESAGPQPSRGDKRLYFVLMTICIGLFVISWAVLDRYSVTAAVIVSVVALAIPPFAAIIANARSATDRRRPLRSLSLGAAATRRGWQWSAANLFREECANWRKPEPPSQRSAAGTRQGLRQHALTACASPFRPVRDAHDLAKQLRRMPTAPPPDAQN